MARNSSPVAGAVSATQAASAPRGKKAAELAAMLERAERGEAGASGKAFAEALRESLAELDSVAGVYKSAKKESKALVGFLRKAFK